jgi:hypothetical protein
MAYLVNQARVASITIGGVNYTSNLLSWQVSDSSAFKNGLISTTGQVVLGENPAGQSLGDYERNQFKRGVPVILDIQDPVTSASIRHPRGYLYVISTGYNAESSSLEIDIGCRLTLAALNDDPSEILPLVPLPLEPERQDLSNCGASFASAGQCLYQDNQGSYQVVTFFDGDTPDLAAAGEWVSVLQSTAISARPMLGGEAIPDTVKLAYQVAAGLLGSESSKIEETITESYYFIQYPATTFARIGAGLGGIDGVSTTSTVAGRTSACGNSPGEPAGNPDLIACNEGYQTSEEPTILEAYNRVIDLTYYEGPANQNNKSTSYKYGPAVELNGQYFSDLFAYCRYTWATACNPNGSCAFEGMNEILQGYTETTSYFGPAGELVKTVVDNYDNILTAAQPFDWRAGSVDGLPREFSEINYINGSTTRTVRVGSGTTLTYNKRALSIGDVLATTRGAYYIDGKRVYLSPLDSNGQSSIIIGSILGKAENQATVCSPVYDPATKYYVLTCPWPVAYITTSSGFEWPAECKVSYWDYSPAYTAGPPGYQTTPAYLVFDVVGGEIREGESGVLNIHDTTSNVSVSSPNGVFYRSSRTVTENSYVDDVNIEDTYTWTSSADKQTGIFRASLDALNGTLTRTRRRSRTITAAPLAPDSVAQTTANTEERTAEYPIFVNTYVEPPVEAGPYVVEEQMPVPLLLPTADEILAAVDVYSSYLIRFIKGDSLGYTIGESLRPEIVTGWRPGMPFRFVDQEKGKILALRMDACSWGVTQTETAVVTNGIWVGDSNGTLTVPSNLQGNSIPSLDEDPPTPPSNVITPPAITGETYTTTGPLAFVIQVHFGTKIVLPFSESTSILTPAVPTDIAVSWTSTCWVSGLILQPGNLLSLTATGSLPIGANGTLVTAGATLINANLFGA